MQHSLGYREAAEDVDRSERYRGNRQRREQRAVRYAGQRCNDDDRSGEDDSVDRVGGRHQRRVQRRRHLGDHFESHEDREQKYGKRADETCEFVQDWPPPSKTLPSRAITAPLATSSFMSISSTPSLIHGERSAWTLRE